MTRFLTFFIAIFFALPAAADPLHGIWRTKTYFGEYAYVRFDACGDKTCGVVVRTFKKSGEFKGGSLGKTLVSNMVNEGGGSYTDGRIHRPDTGQSAPLKINLNGATMGVSACLGSLCRNETWTRIK